MDIDVATNSQIAKSGRWRITDHDENSMRFRPPCTAKSRRWALVQQSLFFATHNAWPDRESFSPQRCGHLIIGDFGLADGGAAALDRHELNPGCYGSSV
jgi:hypothetical protein